MGALLSTVNEHARSSPASRLAHGQGMRGGELRRTLKPIEELPDTSASRNPSRNLQDERCRALRLAQEHAGEDRRRPPAIADPGTSALELRPRVKLKNQGGAFAPLTPQRRRVCVRGDTHQRNREFPGSGQVGVPRHLHQVEPESPRQVLDGIHRTTRPPRPRPSRPSAVDLQSSRDQAHALAVSHPRHHHAAVACRATAGRKAKAKGRVSSTRQAAIVKAVSIPVHWPNMP